MHTLWVQGCLIAEVTTARVALPSIIEDNWMTDGSGCRHLQAIKTIQLFGEPVAKTLANNLTVDLRV